ncbi:MAG: pyridoxal-phosphate dependent enzyme [Thermoproteota archaeon]
MSQMGGERIDAFVAGVSTSGTLIGIRKALEEKNSSLKLIAVEPEKSPSFYHRFHGGDALKIEGIPHKIESIGEGFVSKILEEEMSLVDDVILVGD